MVTKQEPLYMCVAWTERCPAQFPQTRGGTLAPQSSRLPLFPGSPPAQLREQEVASGSCEAPLDQAPLHTGHQGQQNSPTKRTSRSDFTGLLLRVFSAGHSLSWLQAQTLDELLSCKTPQRGQSRAKRSSGRACFVFPVQPPRRHICCLFWRARTGSCCSVPIINLLKAPEVIQETTGHTVPGHWYSSALERPYSKQQEANQPGKVPSSDHSAANGHFSDAQTEATR